MWAPRSVGKAQSLQSPRNPGPDRTELQAQTATRPGHPATVLRDQGAGAATSAFYFFHFASALGNFASGYFIRSRRSSSQRLMRYVPGS
jgi:hypothetical protein